MKASERRALKEQSNNNVKNNVEPHETSTAVAVPTEEKKPERPQNKHLKPIKPGEVRNPNGRPKGVLNYKTRINMALEQLAEEFAKSHNIKYAKDISTKKRKPITGADVDIMGDVFKQYVNMARNGNLKAIDSLLDRTYGKAKQPVELTGKDGGAVEFSVQLVEARKRAREMLDRWHPKEKEEAKK